MIYIGEKDLLELGISWKETIGVIENAVKCIDTGDFAQPIKPYLRYRDRSNRIIAMPAFVGGKYNVAGIKWIASFPQNIHKNLPRAHSVVILNDADTGRPVSIINTALLSIIRTASVTGLMMSYYDKFNTWDDIRLGIVGWGPIGQYHLNMCTELFGDRISKIYLYDLKPINKETIGNAHKDKIHIAKNWQDAYVDANVFITCTVSSSPYIDIQPKKGTLQLNISLRDYKTDIYDYVKDTIIVDDWDEVCREKTDIEMLHIEKGLKREDTKNIIDIVCRNGLNDFTVDQPVMFNPMGMGVFDIAMGSYYVNKALESRDCRMLE